MNGHEDTGTDGALRIDAVTVPGGGTIGMTHLPGRRQLRDGAGREWRRDLAADLDAVERWGAHCMVSLVETREFERYGIPHFAAAAGARRFDWFQLPIVDMGTPTAAFVEAWDRHGAALQGVLATGGRVLVHCAGGYGRTGMIAARLLVEHGLDPVEAIGAVRAARPGTIETAAQERFVLSRAALGSAQRIGGE